MDSISKSSTSVAFGRFRVLLHRRELLADGKPVKLGGRAFDVLMALIEEPGAVLSNDALMARVWPDRIVEGNNLHAQISALRAAFGPERNLIRTVPGRGYQFNGEIRGLPAAAKARADTAAIASGPRPSGPQTNLPAPVSELIGRDEEIAEILNLATARRLVTLTGTGGIGKTRLALALARELLPHFADGAWLAELSALADPGLVPATVAAAVGLDLGGGEPSAQRVAHALTSRRLLLVVDNCEHVIGAAAEMVEAVLRTGFAVQIIATSREPLRVEGEWVYPVPPLEVPAEHAEADDDPLRYGAVGLFIERARAAEPRFAPDRRIMTTIAAICRRLDGMPLAIELAAARAATLGIEELAARLDDRFHLLTGGRRTALPRHQTLRATLDWSYELLPEAERVILRRLGVFAGYFSLEAAGAVVASDELKPSEVVDGLSSLVAKSLVSSAAEGSPVRYRLLETTRAYALEKLVERGEHEPLARRHARYYGELFAPAEAESEARSQAEWLTLYGRDIDNVRAGLDWAFSPSGDRQIGVALTIAAVPLWVQLSLLDECRERVQRALQTLDAGDPAMARQRMQLSAALAWSLMYGVGRAREAGPAWATTLELADRLDDRDYRLRALWGLCIDQFNNGEFRTALEYARRFADLVADSVDVIELIMGDRILGTALHYLGDQTSARRHIDSALARLAQLGPRSQTIRLRFDMRVSTHYFQARILWLQGLADQALRAVEHNIEEGRAIGHALTFCSVLGQAACPIAFLVGDLDAAARHGAMLLDHTERHPIRLWRLWARCFNGLLAAKRADAGAVEVLSHELEEVGDARFLPRFLLLHGELAACLGEAGKMTEGLAIVEETLTRCEVRDERWYLPELLRIKGELLLRQGAPRAAPIAEDHFGQALDLAHRQGALSWELRAAISLARLRLAQERPDEARQVLEPVYGRFTEGFGTAGMKEAKALLDGLQ
jgi:predicted ATPase/DNA-binding winged helix-turn-helix (wHTH) protein